MPDIKSFIWYDQDTPIAKCTYSGSWGEIKLISYERLNQDFGWEYQFIPDFADSDFLQEAFAERVVPAHRFRPSMVKEYKTRFYNPELMCRGSHGVTPQDTFWMKFENDPPGLCYADVRIR